MVHGERGAVSALVIGLVVVVVILLMGGCFVVSGYNKPIQLEEQVKEKWAQVENQLKRRNDLIPNYVNVVKGYAKHEKEVFENLAKARSNYAGAKTINEKAKAATEMESALSRLMMIVENYPDLRSNANFLKLQDELAGTENRIAVERKRYNESVRELNAHIRSFPGSSFAGMAGVGPAEYFEVAESEKKVPEVKFD